MRIFACFEFCINQYKSRKRFFFERIKSLPNEIFNSHALPSQGIIYFSQTTIFFVKISKLRKKCPIRNFFFRGTKKKFKKLPGDGAHDELSAEYCLFFYWVPKKLIFDPKTRIGP